MKVETRWAVASAFVLGVWVGAVQAPGIPQVDALRAVADAITSVVQPYESCNTDSECIEQCMKTLPVNRPESECEAMFSGEGVEDDEFVPADAHYAVYRLVRQ